MLYCNFVKPPVTTPAPTHTYPFYNVSWLLPYMQVKNASSKYIWVEIFNKTIKTEKNSKLLRILKALEKLLQERYYKAFRTIELSKYVDIEPKRISEYLLRLYKKGVLTRTYKRLVFNDSTNLEYVWGLSFEDIVLYVFDKLREEGKGDLIRLYKKVLEKGVLSSIEAKEQTRNISTFEYIFYKALKLINIRNGKYCKYYVSPLISEKRVKELIEVKDKLTEMYIINRHKDGKNFENFVREFLYDIKDIFSYKISEIKEQVFYRIGEKHRKFDFVVKLKPYLLNVEIKGLPTLDLVIEVKDTPTGEATLSKHLLECMKIFGYCFIPLVITSEPRKSAFTFVSKYKIGFLTDSELKKMQFILKEQDGREGKDRSK